MHQIQEQLLSKTNNILWSSNKGSKALIVFFLFYSLISSGQNQPIDSLIALSHTHLSDTVRLNTLINISVNLLDLLTYPGNKNNALTIAYADTVIELGLKLKYDSIAGYGLITKGRLLRRFKQYARSLDVFDSAMAVAKRCKVDSSNKNIMCGIIELSKSISYQQMGKISLQIDALYNAIAYFENTQQETGNWYTSCYLNLGDAYINLNSYERAIQTYTKGIKLNEKNATNTNYAIFKIATAYLKLGNIVIPKEIIDTAHVDLFDGRDSSSYFQIKGQYCIAINQLDSAIHFFNLAVNKSIRYSVFDRVSMLQDLANAYLQKKENTKAKAQLDAIKTTTDYTASPYTNIETTSLTFLYYLNMGNTSMARIYYDSLERQRITLREKEAIAQVQSKEAESVLSKYKMDAALQTQKERLARDKKDELIAREIYTQKIIRNAFITGSVLLVLLIFVLINRYKLKRTLDMERMRSRISRDLHDDIGSTLSSINILSRTALNNLQQTDNEKTNNTLEKINERSQRLLTNMNDIIWNIKPTNDTMEEVMSRMREYATSLLEAKKINFEMDFPAEKINYKLTLETKSNLYLIFKEAVNNLAKYSGATQAKLILHFDNEHIRMKIEDNGAGFNINELKHRGGLTNMQHRAEEMNATLKIESVIGQGTVVELVL